MIDLETLGTKPGSAILSIGAVRFKARLSDFGEDYVPQSAGRLREDSFYMKVHLPDSIRQGFSVDGDTIKWWMRQSDEARAAAFPQDRQCDVGQVARSFRDWFVLEKESFVWGNGANFDIPLMESFLGNAGLRTPWKYTNVRCFRTLKNLVGYDTRLVPPNELAHDALADAVHQAQVMQAIAYCNKDLVL